jgi:hypothetical protein
MSDVVIGDILPYTQATAIASQTVFMTNWTANFASDVVVYQTPVGDAPDDATQILAYPADYSVSFIGSQEEVQVTLVTPANAGDIITITRQTPADRENLYTNTNFTPSMLNNDFGILTLVDQQAQLVNQLIAPRYNYSAVIAPNMSFPNANTILPILSAGQVWVMNLSGTGIITANFPSGDTGSGTINFGVQNELAWYAANGTTLSGLPTQDSSVLGTDINGTPSWSTLSSLLDSNFGSVQGSILYRDASLWNALPPGTSAYFLQTHGASSNPTWSPSLTLNVQILTTTGTYIPTVGMTYCTVELQGPGGGAGGSAAGASQYGIGGNGAGGGYCRKLFTAANIGASAAVVLPAGGAGGVGNNPGATASNATFIPVGPGAALTAGGGAGGLSESNIVIPTVASPVQGQGGTATGGDINIPGEDGDQGVIFVVSTNNAVGNNGAGGGSTLGLGGASFWTANSLNGNNGINYGGGGSGAYTLGTGSNTGGTGANSICIITEYI